MTSIPAIGFNYRHSRGLEWVLASILALALLAIVLCGLPWYFKSGLGLLALCCYIQRGDAYRTGCAITWLGDGSWRVQHGDASDRMASLQSFRDLGACICLRLRENNGSITNLLLTYDNSDADTRRRLRMRLAVRLLTKPVV